MALYQITSQIERLEDATTADQISQFLLSEHSFDDQRHTPGERIHFAEHPLASLEQEQYYYWYIRNHSDDIIGVLSCMENEQQTGGYVLDYIVVHKDYRQQGIAKQFIQFLFQFIKQQGGRYILTYTCDLSMYAPIQYLFTKSGFERIGYYPDYYYEGEGRITFYYKL